MSERKCSDELLEKFDNGEDITEEFDFEHAETHDGFATKRVNVDFPQWVIDALDEEARRIGVGRQAVIKTWIVERLDSGRKPA